MYVGVKVSPNYSQVTNRKADRSADHSFLKHHEHSRIDLSSCCGSKPRRGLRELGISLVLPKFSSAVAVICWILPLAKKAMNSQIVLPFWVPTVLGSLSSDACSATRYLPSLLPLTWPSRAGALSPLVRLFQNPVIFLTGC